MSARFSTAAQAQPEAPVHDEATGQIRHQANAKDQQNEECEDETDAEQHEFDAFEQELAGVIGSSLVSSSSCLLFCVSSDTFRDTRNGRTLANETRQTPTRREKRRYSRKIVANPRKMKKPPLSVMAVIITLAPSPDRAPVAPASSESARPSAPRAADSRSSQPSSRRPETSYRKATRLPRLSRHPTPDH